MKPLRSVEQTAAVLNISVPKLYKLTAARQVPFTWVGKSIRFTEDHIAQIIAMGEEPVMAAPPALALVRRGHPPAGPSTPPPPPAPPRRERRAS